MIFYLDGHDKINPILQLLICLFPDEEHKRGEDINNSQGDYVVSSLSERDGELYAEAYDGKGGKTCLMCPEGMDREDRRAAEYLRRAMYLLLLRRLEEAPQWGMLTGVKPSKLVLHMFDSGLSTEEADAKLRDYYFVSEKRRRLCLETAKISKQCRDDTGKDDIEIYIGIPFCPAKCSYCSFVSNDVRKWGNMVEPYLQTLLYEVEVMGRTLREHKKTIRSIYVGGGTPSILSEDQLSRLLYGVKSHFDLSGLSEFTFEGGRPETITAEKLRIAHENGIKRISINPQTLNEAVLRGVGRLHTVQDVIDCYNMARETAPFEINMDLIAGLPGDDDESLINSVKGVIALEPDNITLHSMARKKGAPLRFGKTGDLSHETMDLCHEMIYDAGYRPYYLYRQKYSAGGLENVGFMKNNTLCRYNVIMMEETGNVAALGSGGVTKLVFPDGSIERITNPKYPIDYIGRRDMIDENLLKLAKALERD